MSSPTPTPASTPTQSPTPALLPFLFPYIISALQKYAHLAITLPKYVFNFLTFLSWTTFISPLAYLLAPVMTFVSIVFSITIRTPYTFVSWLLDAVFPLYVFCGVACITGGLLGFGGRILSRNMIRAVTEGYTEGGRGYYEETTKNRDEDTAERSAKRRRVERDAGKVKFEYL